MKQMLAKLSAITLLSSLSSLSFAAVTLNVQDNIKVTAINGQAVNTSIMQDPQMTYTLSPGRHVITAKYDRLYEIRNKDHDYLRSANITVTADLKDNEVYQLTMPGQPERYQDAITYSKSPTLAIQKGSQVIVSQKGQASAGLFGGISGSVGGTIGGLFGRGNAVQSNTQAIASISTNGQNTNGAVIQSNQPSNSSSTSGSTLDQFMNLWLKATPEEREKIRSWVAK